jgi:hypothetical protein
MKADLEVSCLYQRGPRQFRFETFRCRTLAEARKVARVYRLNPPEGYRLYRGPTIKEGNVVLEQYRPP